jgi:hypothetical protein
MTKHNLLQEIQNYSNIAYEQGLKVGSQQVTLEESRKEEGLNRLLKFMKIAKIVGEICPAESIEAINEGT